MKRLKPFLLDPAFRKKIGLPPLRRKRKYIVIGPDRDLAVGGTI